MALCDSCRKFNLHAHSAVLNGRISYQLSKVQTAARTGCPFCAWLIQTVEESVKQASQRDSKTALWVHLKLLSGGHLVSSTSLEQREASARGGLQVNSMTIEVAPRYFSSFWNKWPVTAAADICVAADLGSRAFKNKDVTGRFIGYDVTSDEHIETIKQWLSSCEQHNCCQKTFSLKRITRALPSRCLHITENGLVLKETAGLTARYVTLSHRWNKATELCKTTSSNYSERLAGRGFSGLPKVFEDAVALVRRLDIDYIWIDSLCIVQDKDDEWKHESLKMAEYYQQSDFTVAAAVSSADKGLQPQTQAYPKSLVRLPYYDRDSCSVEHEHFFVYRRHRPLADEYTDYVQRSELTQRAWVFQEMVLSPRVLYFTDVGLFFECHSQLPTNDRGEILPSTILRRNDVDLKFSLYRLAHPGSNGLLLVDFWYRAVESYSAKAITHPEKDRIQAISGIAQELKILSKHPHSPTDAASRQVNGGEDKPPLVLEYISGHWLCDIHYGLLWEQKEGPQEHKKGFEAPSWSWARLMVPVKWAERHKSMRPECAVTGLKTEDDKVYKVQDGFLSLPTDDFDMKNIFTSLIVRCSLVSVWIGDYLSSDPNPIAFPESEQDIATRMTNHWPVFGRYSWRAVCSQQRSRSPIAGWASLETLGTAQQQHGSAPNGTGDTDSVQALLVATHKSEWVGFRLGMLVGSHDIFHVLYVKPDGRELGRPRYKRLGVGRCFELGLAEEFRNAKAQEIVLA